MIGAGPSGLAAAFGCHDRGLRVLVIEAGGKKPTQRVAAIVRAEITSPTFHAPVEIASCAALGGTSHWWGGRSVPLDPVDFWDCPQNWPIGYSDLEPWWQKAAEFLGSALVVSPAPGAFDRLTRHDATRSESWGPELNMARRWRDRLAAKDGPAILLNSRAVGFEDGKGHIAGVRVISSGTERIARARHVVLACGGLGVLRLLLNAERRQPGFLAGRNHLGQGYMGHLTGTIADLVPDQPEDVAAFGCLGVGGGVAARRRITPRAEIQIAEGLANIAFWLDNPPLGDPAHGSGTLSAKYLLLRQAQFGRRLISEGLRALALRGAESPTGPHLRNIAAEPFGTLAGLGRAAVARLTDRYRRPERLLPVGGDGWRLHYHAEQRPDPANRVSLSDTCDPLGQFRLKIDYCFAEADIVSVARAHAILDSDLQAAGAGRLRYLGPPESCLERIRAAASDGYHQIGGTRMSRDASTGVVDADCRVHGLENLWIASSSVFPSAGQANPTLTIVALACRLAHRLAA